jgi:hypothetical protein
MTLRAAARSAIAAVANAFDGSSLALSVPVTAVPFGRRP